MPKSRARVSGSQEMYTTRRGAQAARAVRNSPLAPARGGSMNTTSQPSPSWAAWAKNSPASPRVNQAFFMAFSLAFWMASFTASGFSSTPSTWPAPCLAATRPMVPMPQ